MQHDQEYRFFIPHAFLQWQNVVHTHTHNLFVCLLTPTSEIHLYLLENYIFPEHEQLASFIYNLYITLKVFVCWM